MLTANISTRDLVSLAVLAQRVRPEPIAPAQDWAKIVMAHQLYRQQTDFDLGEAREAEIAAAAARALGLSAPPPPVALAPPPADEALREEVAYWRRDAAARIWWHEGLLKAAREAGDEERGRAHLEALGAAVTASEAVLGGCWHERCELCGEPVRPGQGSCGLEEGGRAHLRCADPGDSGDDVPDPTDADWRARVASGRQALRLDAEDASAAEALDAAAEAWLDVRDEERGADTMAEEGWTLLGPVHKAGPWAVRRADDAYLWDRDEQAVAYVNERAENGSRLHGAAMLLHRTQIAASAAAARGAGR